VRAQLSSKQFATLPEKIKVGHALIIPAKLVIVNVDSVAESRDHAR